MERLVKSQGARVAAVLLAAGALAGCGASHTSSAPHEQKT